MVDLPARLTALRSLLTREGLSAYFLPHTDAHGVSATQSEYLSESDKRMLFISGFTGSNGHMVVTQTEALLWTDGRYFLQAENELGPGWTLMRIARGVPRFNEWLVQNLPEGSVVGFDPFLLSANAVEARRRELAVKGISFRPVPTNLVNEVWTNRPAMSLNPVVRLEDEFAGATLGEKLKKLTGVFVTNSAKYLFVSRLDEIAWLLNLRGSDIPYNPVFFAYLLICYQGNDTYSLVLFIDESKVQAHVPYLSSNSIELFPYDSVQDYLAAITELVLVGDDLNYAISSRIAAPKTVPEVIVKLKSVKNQREVQGMKDCHVRDGRALCRYLAWLEQQLNVGRKDLNEVSAALVLADFRRQETHFQGLSFETISAVGTNAAIIHYVPKEASAATIVKEEVYMVDSGGHYWDGTTDVTRTVHFGVPTPREKECYTRVLLGNLDLCRLVWPSGTGISGADMDVLARRWLWAAGLDYMHGTGHGVGYFLNVHEGPQGISRYRNVALVPGMNVTDEPGYYEEGAFGIRIEDLLFVKCLDSPAGFLGFENIVMCPYDRNLMDMSLLSPRDIDYINAYHHKVWEALSPTVDEMTRDWLRRATAPLGSN